MFIYESKKKRVHTRTALTFWLFDPQRVWAASLPEQTLQLRDCERVII
jgi:hypothetical protein